MWVYSYVNRGLVGWLLNKSIAYHDDVKLHSS